MHPTLAALMRPQPRRRVTRVTIGAGRPCPDGHGPTLVMRSGAHVCVHHDHFAPTTVVA
jgi:hypothetical protein